MKKIFIALFFIAFQFLLGQSYKIQNAAAGSLEGFASLVDGDELYGYVELRKLDDLSEKEVKFKYIVLDKNMNIINTGEFTETKIKKKCAISCYQIIYNNEHLLFNLVEVFNPLSESMPLKCKYKILDLSTNKFISHGTYNKNIKADEDNVPKLFKDFSYYYCSALSDVGFLVQNTSTINIKKNLKTPYSGMNFKGETIWSLDIKKAEPKHEYVYNFFNMDENSISLLLTKNKNDKKVSDHILIIDAKTGNDVSFTDLSNEKYTLRFMFSTLKENKLIMIGRYFEKEKRDRVGYDESLGLYKREIDIKTGKITSDIFLPYNKFNSLDIDENGKIKKEGKLAFKKIDMNPDGSFFILAETYRDKSTIDLYTELYTFLLDKDFKPVSIKSFDTEKSRGSKYSFSQKLLNNVGKVYFFYDKNEEKKFELNLINFDYNSKNITVTKMNVDTKNSSLSVMPAKTGYVAIKEYFKNPKKDENVMEIRLEKLNYERQ